MAVRSVLMIACGLLLLTGCVGAMKATTVGASTPTGTASPGNSPATAENASVLALRRAVKSYGQALGGGAPDAVREGLKVTAANSVSYHYLDHVVEMSQATLAGSASRQPPVVALPCKAGWCPKPTTWRLFGFPSRYSTIRSNWQKIPRFQGT
jgi:hypothetical protein